MMGSVECLWPQSWCCAHCKCVMVICCAAALCRIVCVYRVCILFCTWLFECNIENLVCEREVSYFQLNTSFVKRLYGHGMDSRLTRVFVSVAGRLFHLLFVRRGCGGAALRRRVCVWICVNVCMCVCVAIISWGNRLKLQKPESAVWCGITN